MSRATLYTIRRALLVIINFQKHYDQFRLIEGYYSLNPHIFHHHENWKWVWHFDHWVISGRTRAS